MKFVAACNKFFGKKEGQGLQQFAQELGQLTAQDKAELAPMLSEALGEPVEVVGLPAQT